MVYVLTTFVKESKEWRPVAVLDEAHLDAANQWANASKNNDWVPLEMNDMSLTGLATGAPMDFKPQPPKPHEETLKDLKDTNERLVNIIEQLATRHKDKEILKVIKQIKTSSEGSPFESELLRKND